MIMNKKNPKFIVFPKHNDHELHSAVDYKLRKILPNGWVDIAAKIPTKNIDPNGLIAKDVILLLRTPCPQSRLKLRSLYGVIASYDYHVVTEAEMDERLAA